MDTSENLPPTSIDSAQASFSTADEDVLRNTWREKCKPLKKIYYEMKTGQGKCKPFHDVTFQVGSGTNANKFTAHRLILSISCKYFEDYFCENKFVSPGKLIRFPELDPLGFKKTLEHMYTDKVDTETKSDANKLIATLGVAKNFLYNELVAKCFAELRLLITSETAVEMYEIAVANKEERLEELARVHISNHIKEVYSSKWFESSSVNQVCTLLKLNNWHLAETEVFENVKRWCLRNNDKKFFREDGTVRGDRLSAAMGGTFFNIRFLLMKKDDWETIVAGHRGLFTGDECHAFLLYFLSSNETREVALKQQSLQKFASRNGLIERGSSTSPNVSPEDSNETANEQMGGNCSAKQIASTATTNNVELEPNPSPTKRVRLEEVPASSESIPMQTLDNFINQLANGVERNDIRVIDKTLEIGNALPSKRVPLPNLSKFRIRLESKKKFPYGTELKAQVRKVSENLYRFLFFDKNNEIGPSCSNKLEKLLNQKVDISLHFRDCLIFSISHSEGSLTMNLFVETESILKYLKTFPLKKLAISESTVSSLEDIRRDLLEVIVFRKVAGLINPLDFIRRCPSLKEFTCDDVGTEQTTYLVNDILHKNPNLEKLCLENCNLGVGKKMVNKYTGLRELYLSNCKVDKNKVHRMLSLLPSLKRLQLNGTKVESEFINKILNAGSLEWVLVSGMIETQKVVAVKQFLYRLLGYPSLSKTGLGKPFVIEQVLDGSKRGKSWSDGGKKVASNNNYNRRNSRWTGTKLIEKFRSRTL